MRKILIALMFASALFGQTNISNTAGTVTVAQSTASSLKVDLSGTAANATALNVGQATGSNLHAVIDTGSTTAVTGNVAVTSAAQDTAFQTTGSAVPAKAIYLSANGSGNSTGLITCDNFTPINISTAVSTKIISLVSAKNVYICSFHLFSAGTQNIAWISGTKVSTECDTGTAGLAGGTTAATGYNLIAQTGLAVNGGMSPVIKTASTGKDVCLISSAAVQISGVVAWTQF